MIRLAGAVAVMPMLSVIRSVFRKFAAPAAHVLIDFPDRSYNLRPRFVHLPSSTHDVISIKRIIFSHIINCGRSLTLLHPTQPQSALITVIEPTKKSYIISLSLSLFQENY